MSIEIEDQQHRAAGETRFRGPLHVPLLVTVVAGVAVVGLVVLYLALTWASDRPSYPGVQMRAPAVMGRG